MKPARWWMPTARKHSIADARFGRPWACACAPCRQARHYGYLRHRMSPRWWLDPRYRDEAGLLAPRIRGTR
jgi:hypothetical protein